MTASDPAFESARANPEREGERTVLGPSSSEFFTGEGAPFGVVPPSDVLDRVVDLATELFDVPVVLLHFSEGADCYRSTVEGAEDVVAIASALAEHIVESEDTLIVPDAGEEGAPVPEKGPFRFFAGVPLICADGTVIGALCVMDTEPRSASSSFARSLSHLRDVIGREVTYQRETAAREAEAVRLRRVRNEYQAAFEHARDALFLIEVHRTDDDVEFRLLRLNDTHESITGLSTEGVRGQTPKEILGETVGGTVEAHYRECVEAREAIEYEEELSFPKGQSTWQTKLSPIILDGDVTHIVGVSREITHRKKVHQELQDTNQRLRLALEAAEAGTFAFDVPADEVEWDERTLEIYGMEGPSRRVDASLLYQFVREEDKAHLRDVFYGAVENEESYDVTYRIRRPGGEQRVVRSHGIVVRDEAGAAQRVIGINQDVTDRRSSQRRLRVMSEALRQAQEGVLITEAEPFEGPSPPIIFANSAFEEMTGYREEEVLGNSLGLLEGPETDHEVLNEMRTALERGEPWSGETVNHRKDGSTFVAEWTVAPVRDEDNNLEHWVFVQRDVTRRRELEREIIAISDAERRRIGQHLHDTLGGQLSGARMMAENLSNRLDAGQEVSASKPRQLAELIQSAEEKVRRLSHSLMPMDGPDECLPLALRKLCDRRRGQLEADCKLDIDDSLPTLSQDVETHLYRIASEALTNAVKHADPNEIQIALRNRGGSLELLICDDGTGLPDESPKQGAGLRIMQYRANLIGAAFSLESRDESGTVVRCSLSLQKARPESEEADE